MYKHIKKFIPFLIFLGLFSVVVATIEVILSIQIKNIIDIATNQLSGSFSDEAIKTLILAFVLLPLVVGLAIFRGKFLKKALERYKHNYLNGILKKNINEFNQENNANYISIMTNDFDQIEKNFLVPLIDLIHSLTNLISGIVLFVIISPIILLISFGLVIVNIIISVIASSPLKKHTKERSKLFEDYTGYIKEVLSAFHIIKTNNLEDKVKQDFHEKSKLVQEKGYVIDKISSFIFAIQNANFTITFLALFLIVAFMSIEGFISFGVVVLIINSIEKLVWPIINLSESLPKMFMVGGIVKKLEESLKNKDNYLETVEFNDFEKIKFNNLTFSYEEDNYILNDVNLELESGKKYLIIGPSGGGKSTVLRLLRKYFQPNSGDILIDDVSLRDIKKESYFQLISNIEQNIFLFEDTIRNNLTLYKDYSDEEIYDAIEKAGLTDFINSLPDGLETIIYDNGKNISGGEKSRIAIARGLINKSKIIFLDETFASLDPKKAKAIEKSILALKNVTIINVSHVVFREHQDLYDGIFVVNNQKIIPKES